MKLLLSLLCFFLVTAASFAGPKEAYQELLDGKAVFFDVRENDEVKEGMIKGALWMPLSSLQTSPEETIEKVKSSAAGKTIYVYCRSGRRSQVFIDKIKESGMAANNLGGFQDLLNLGLPRR